MAQVMPFIACQLHNVIRGAADSEAFAVALVVASCGSAPMKRWTSRTRI
jgi:hypothetical protein